MLGYGAIPVFNGEEGSDGEDFEIWNWYETWSRKMMVLFEFEELWDVVEKGYEEDTTDAAQLEENKRKDRKALYLIKQGVSDYIFPVISKATTSKEAWEDIEKVVYNYYSYEGESEGESELSEGEGEGEGDNSKDEKEQIHPDKVKDHVAISIEEMLKDFKPTPTSKGNRSIFKVHEELRRGNEEFYDPQVVAIGPNHQVQDKDKTLLASKENLKMSYMHHLLNPTAEESAGSLVEAVRRELKRVKKCYGMPSLLDDKLVTMLVIDGCFIIGLLRDFVKDPKLLRRMSHKTNDYCLRFIKRNAVMSDSGTLMNSAFILFIKALQNDLMLMDNQIPFFIIKTLYSVINSNGDSLQELKKLASKFLRLKYEMPESLEIIWPNTESDYDNCHLLYIAHKTLCSKREEKIKEFELKGETTCLVNSATKLEEANVELKPANKKSESIFDITFSNGYLTIPCFAIDDQFEIEIRNFIALELCQQNGNRLYCDYVIFMDHLIASSEDVELLIRRGIITNYMIDANLVNKMFTNLTKKVVRSHPYTYSNISKELNEYCNRNRNQWLASFKHKHLKDPMTAISIIAASLLLLLTITQTVLTIIK